MAVATFFYAEILAVLLLCSPFISAQKWQKIFSSRLVILVLSHGQPFFGILLLILALLFLDAMWEIRKFDTMEKSSLLNCPSALEHHQMKLFRAQRNLHVTGFTLLLSLLLRRLASLQNQQASLQASREALQRQAEGAGEVAQRYLTEKERLLEEAEAQASLRIAAEVSQNQALRADLRKLAEELEACRRNLGRAQAEALHLYKRCEVLTEELARQGEQQPGAGPLEAEGIPEDQMME
ncbi:B-cell receptor-associated protein 31-like [Dromiciops gliroides]|uniref:B-cell receptor-associated protein 31-like n=1 Tax=Dromiciops gliroides TaxID=33562 RepID=UPI001CC4BF82|nr:B-cell receptor-associated protein 31-like [Dromiciops gliroides]